MEVLALAMLGTILVLTFFVRVAISLRQTGTTGLIGLRPGAGPVEALSGVLFAGGIVLGALSPYLVLRDELGLIDALDSDPIQLIGLVAAVAAVIGLEMQVRLVEEPYLRRAHGDEFGAYEARVGRFVPGVGRS